ncbi:hypothetical protein NQZ68_008727 [Dissostichus eleginoides]|nr:hypothetical protein NQZ68_008727 [Dissostichus eleginoides]
MPQLPCCEGHHLSEGGVEELEEDALGWNEAQLLEVVLVSGTLEAAGRGLAAGEGVSGHGKGLQWPKHHHVTAV